MKQYDSVKEMIKDLGDPDFAEAVIEEIERRQTIKKLIAHRVKNDMSQQDIAEKLGWSLRMVENFEHTGDDDVLVGDLKGYAEAVGLVLEIRLGIQL